MAVGCWLLAISHWLLDIGCGRLGGRAGRQAMAMSDFDYQLVDLFLQDGEFFKFFFEFFGAEVSDFLGYQKLGFDFKG